jgi:hypothetical protein
MAQVEIIKVGHALVEGDRGARGGKPSKDSIWGIANVSGVLLTFSGRRGAQVLKYKTRPKAELDTVLALFDEKLAGKDVKGIQYTEIVGTDAQEALVPGLAAQIGKGYHAAKAAGKLNTNATAKKPAKAEKVVKAKKVDPKKVSAFPTAASVAAKAEAK